MKTRFSIIRMLNFFKKGDDMKILLTLVFVAAIATLGVMNGNVQGQGSEHPTEHPKAEHPKAEASEAEASEAEASEAEASEAEASEAEAEAAAEHPKSEHQSQVRASRYCTS
jgi:hypothetical protein